MKRSGDLLIVITLFSGILFVSSEEIQTSVKKESLEELIIQRNKTVNNNNFDEAIKIDQKIITLYPETEGAKRALLDIAENYYRSGDYKNAIKFYQDVLKNSSEKNIIILAIKRITLCYRNLGEYEEGNKEIKKFIEKYPELRKELLLEIDTNYRYSKKYSEMVDIYLEMVKSYPEDTEMIKEVMETMNLIPPEAIGNEEAAVKIINLYNYIAENSKQFSDKCLYRIGNIYKNLGKNGEAIKFYNKAIESSEDKNFTITLTLEIAELYKKEGEKKSSEEILQKVLSQSFDGLDYSLLARIAQSCGQLGKYEKEVEILRQLVEKSPKTEIAKNAQYRIACIYNFCLKNFIQAIEEYKKFINLYPNDWRITLCWKQIGGIHLELQEYEKALEVQKKLLEINPDDPSPKVMIKLINDYYKKGTIPTEKDIEKVLKEIKGERKK